MGEVCRGKYIFELSRKRNSSGSEDSFRSDSSLGGRKRNTEEQGPKAKIKKNIIKKEKQKNISQTKRNISQTKRNINHTKRNTKFIKEKHIKKSK